MLPELDNDEWARAFAVAAHRPERLLGTEEHAPKGGFTREDVAEVLSIAVNGCWIGVFQLKDGRFAAVRTALHLDIHEAAYSDDLDNVLRHGCTREERQRLGMQEGKEPK